MFNDKEFLSNSAEWPKMRNSMIGYCCLRKGIYPNNEHAFVLSSEPLELNFGYIQEGGNGDFRNYESIDAILADGWTVD
jgi:hypothetical protein